MKYTISINQKVIVESGLDLSFDDAAILDFINSFTNSEKVQKMLFGGKLYYWISYNLVSTELPLLKLKKDTVYRKFKHFIEIGLLSAHPDNATLNRAYFAVNSLFLSLFYSNDQPQEQNPYPRGKQSVRPPDANPPYNTTIHNSTIISPATNVAPSNNEELFSAEQPEEKPKKKSKKEKVLAEVDECYPEFVRIWTLAYPILGFNALSGRMIKEIIIDTKSHLIESGKITTKEVTCQAFQYILDYVKQTGHFCDGKPITTLKQQYRSIIHEIIEKKHGSKKGQSNPYQKILQEQYGIDSAR